VTTGGQILLSNQDLKDCGAIVNNVLSVIEREQQGRDNLEDAGLTFLSLFKMEELIEASLALNYYEN
jgi:orotate phosphoribosyltransferase